MGPYGPEPDPARSGKDRRDFADFYAEYDRERDMERLRRPQGGKWVCTAPITYVGHDALQRDIDNLQAALHDTDRVADAFLPVVAPASAVPIRHDQYYGSEEAFLYALADALHEEYTLIAEAGLMVQVDDAFLATMYDSTVPPGTLREYREWAELRIDVLNHALRDIPEARSRYHVCWGSWNGPHTNDIALGDIVDLILRVRAGHYVLEQANPRHAHEWRARETVGLPPGKKLIPGVVTHSTNVVENPRLVADRLTRLAALVGPERIIAGTDCGFAQSPGVQRVHPSVMWAKLRALSDGAAIASHELFG